MKNLKYIALSAFIVFFVGAMGVLFFSPVSFSTAASQVFDEQTFDGEKVKNIDIETSVNDVELLKGSGNDIKVSMEGKISQHLKGNFTLEADVSGNTLKAKIEAKKQQWFVGFNVIDVNLIVTVPAHLYDEIKIKTATGDVYSEEFEAAKFGIDTSTGDIELKGMKGQTLEIETSTGDLFLHDIIAEMDLQTSTGDIHVDESEGRLSLKSQTGDAFIKLVSIKDDIKMETSTGDIEVAVDHVPGSLEIDLSASTGDTNTNISGMDYATKAEHEIEGKKGSGGPEVHIRSSTGDITLIEN